tara:strand:+ start:1721 stop:1894 length:174 start_codon:yes stop_codon:yes gene_type:complete
MLFAYKVVTRRPAMKKKLFSSLIVFFTLLWVWKGFSKPPIPDTFERPEEKEETSRSF